MMLKLKRRLCAVLGVVLCLFAFALPALANNALAKAKTTKVTIPVTVKFSTNNQKVSNKSTIKPNGIVSGDVDLSYSGHTLNWKITVPGITGFSGLMGLTDLTTGLSGGNWGISGLSGSETLYLLSGHLYQVTVTGVTSPPGVIYGSGQFTAP